MGFTSLQLSNLEKQYKIDEITFESLSNNTDMLNKMVETIVTTLHDIVEEKSEALENKDNLDELNSQLYDNGAYLIVRKNDELFYNGSSSDVTEILKELPAYGAVSAERDKGVYIGHDVQALVKQDSQFIISTHSPILMTFPDAEVVEITDEGIQSVNYKDTEHFVVTKRFMDAPEKIVESLLGDISTCPY